jgi:hypothetical protein
MSYTYATYVAALAQALGDISVSDSDFLATLPEIIDDAEQRCYRELDLLGTVVTDTSGVFTANQRTATLPQALGRFINVKRLNFFTGTYPAGRTQLVPLPASIIDALFPSETGTSGVNPQYYAPVTDQVFMIAPSPPSAFSFEVIGTIRPTPLSSGNTATFLTNYLSDLFFAASMVSATGSLLKNFGAQSENPQQGLSWESQFQTRLASAKTEELRRKYAFGGIPMNKAA